MIPYLEEEFERCCMHGSVAVFLVLLGEDNGFFSLVLLKKEGDEVGQGDEVVQGCLGVRWQ